MTKAHVLQCPTEHFDAIERGDKTFNVRWNDGNYEVGDALILQRFDPVGGYTMVPVQGGTAVQEIYRRVTYVLQGGQFGIEPGYVVLGLDKLPLAQAR